MSGEMKNKGRTQRAIELRRFNEKQCELETVKPHSIGACGGETERPLAQLKRSGVRREHFD